jgi:hypothetical protein
MAREGFAAILCTAVLVLFLSPRCPAAASDDSREAAIASALAVQTAFQQGREHMERGNYGAAVEILETQLPRINGNREYLARLRDAYRGYIKQLRLANRGAETQVYLKRLEILDPAARADFDALAQRPSAAQSASDAAATTPTAAELAAGSTTSRPPALLARGKMTDEERAAPLDDPFHPSNRLRGSAQSLLDLAAQEWEKRQYPAAGRLYEQAARAEPDSTTGCRDQWAYCKLFVVVQQLSQPGSTPLPYSQMEEEVRSAMTLSPRLESQAKDLLSRIQQRRGETAEVPVRHAEKAMNGWAVAETAHYRLYHTQDRALAERVIRVAELNHAATNRQWFGDEGESWGAPCALVLHAKAKDYSQATGKPATWPAHSTIRSEGARVVSRRIDLRCDDPDLLTCSLPHEATHVLLAGRFGGPDLPRWADEGIALLNEPPEKIEGYLQFLAQHRQDGLLFSVRDLLTLNTYPEGRRVTAFHAQSIALTQYFVRQGGALRFTRFLNEALRYGYDRALQRTYGYNLAALEQSWRQAAQSDTTQAALAR